MSKEIGKAIKAFPGQDDDRWYLGMTLRDYFAAQALSCFVEALKFPTDEEAANVAAACFAYADAMLAERERKP